MLQLGLMDDHCKAILMRLAMIQSGLRGHNTSSQLISSIKGTFVESPNTRKVTRVGMVNLFWLNGIEPRAFHWLNQPHHSATQDQQYKIVLYARHKLRVPLIRSCTIKQSSCNASIQFISDLQTLRPRVEHLQIRYKPHGCVITVTCIHMNANFHGAQMFVDFMESSYP